MKKLARIMLVAAGLGLGIVADGALAATACNGPLSGNVVGGVVVNAGAPCTLGGANVSGGVQVNSGGILFVCGSTINGGLVSNGATAVIVGAEEIDCDGDVINGGVQISNTGPSAPGGPPSLALERSTINGSVHLIGNRGLIAVAGNRIAGGLFCANNASDLEDEGSPSVVTGPIHCDFAD